VDIHALGKREREAESGGQEEKGVRQKVRRRDVEKNNPLRREGKTEKILT
jgi:hypothetical protein